MLWDERIILKMDIVAKNDDEQSLLVLRREMLSRFQCQKSGNCCRCPGVVYATAQEISSMASLLDHSSIEFREKYVVKRKGWDVIADQEHRPNCFLKKDNTCEVYDGRPKACRTYPDWPEIWSSKARVEAECGVCPGLKKAYKDVSKTD